MTLDEIRDHATCAETIPGELDFGELPFKALAAWVEMNPQQYVDKTENFDVESVKGMFEKWWNNDKKGGTP